MNTKQHAVTGQIAIAPVRFSVLTLNIISKSGLICHAYSEKTRKQMQDKQSSGSRAAPREKRNPQEEYEACFYKLEDGSYGFPCNAFKQAAVRAAKMTGIAMTDARQMFFILPDGRDVQRQIDCVRIIGEPTMRTDEVRIQGSAMDLRYRPEFTSWSVNLTIEYDLDNISPDAISSLVYRAGLTVGVGDWRPEKNGDFGRWKVGELAVNLENPLKEVG